MHGSRESVDTLGTSVWTCSAWAEARLPGQPPHGDEAILALDVIVGGDGDLAASCELDGVASLQEACPDLWALFHNASRCIWLGTS